MGAGAVLSGLLLGDASLVARVWARAESEQSVAAKRGRMKRGRMK